MAKTKKKELAFFMKDPDQQVKFLETVRKKVTMVNMNIELKSNKIRLVLSGTHESLQYAVELIKQIQSSLKIS